MSVVIDPSPPGTLYCPTCEKYVRRSDATNQRCPDDNTKLVHLQPSMDALIGRELEGRYTVVERLGAGGMGTVYRAEQHSMGREVAIKVVNGSHLSDPLAIKRFLREAKLASRLNHPNAVGVLDFGQTADGMPFLVMELVDGRTLDAVFRTEGRFAPERLIRIAIQVCDALERAHELKIVHRDIKPSNIMLLRTGRELVKVLDFGLAKSLSVESSVSNTSFSGELLGTPAFMPPEIALGQDCDHRSDLYSLGMTFYFLAAGEMPFQGGSTHEWLYHHTETPPPIPAVVPEPLRTIILRMIAKKPSDRFATAAEARTELDEALLHLRERRMPTPIPIAPVTPPPDLATPAARLRGKRSRESDLRELELGHTIAAVATPQNGNRGIEQRGGLPASPALAAPTQLTGPRARYRWLAAAIAACGLAAVGWLGIRGDDRPRDTNASGSTTVQPASPATPETPTPTAVTSTAKERVDAPAATVSPPAQDGDVRLISPPPNGEGATPTTGAAAASKAATGTSFDSRNRRGVRKDGASTKAAGSRATGKRSELPF